MQPSNSEGRNSIPVRSQGVTAQNPSKESGGVLCNLVTQQPQIENQERLFSYSIKILMNVCMEDMRTVCV